MDHVHTDTPSLLTPALPENMLSASRATSCWNGVTVHVTDFYCDGRVVHRLDEEAHSRLSIVLEEIGQHAEPRLGPTRPCPIAYMPRHMLYAPAGLEIWGFSADTRYVKDVTLTFDLAQLEARLHTRFDDAVVATPRLRFVDDRVWSLAELLANAVGNPDPSCQLYGDGLTAAVSACLFARPMEFNVGQGGLSPVQLRRVLDYLDAHLPDHVALSDLAVLSGLSQWHFSRAFKASTGKAPYRWQLEERIRRAQLLLLDTRASVELVSEATGFANAAHFGRTFRKLAGATPAAWRKARQT